MQNQTGIFVLLKQFYYCANTGTFHQIFRCMVNLPPLTPPPILLGLIAVLYLNSKEIYLSYSIYFAKIEIASLGYSSVVEVK